MRDVTVAKLKNELSKYLRYVKQGETVIVRDRKVAIAEIRPVSRAVETVHDERLLQLAREGIVQLGEDPERLRNWVPPTGEPVGAVDALLEDRKKR